MKKLNDELNEMDKFLRGLFLTKKQRDMLQAVYWLLESNTNERTGRTTLMAFCFIKMAIRHPNTRVYIFDHFPSRRSALRMVATIKNILPKGMKELWKFKFGEDWIVTVN